ncbi:hypothetical protein V8B97DRAFT_1991191 [Scleroderma yunnanense]
MPSAESQSMLEPTDHPVSSEPESLSDSDWLDISGTDRESDNDSIFSSSRGTDHERPSRSRQSSMSYGSSRDGDVDVWEGMIEDSADEDAPTDAPPVLPAPQVDSHTTLQPHEETSLEELRVKEGLDQSMVSTLSSSRSSSLYASTVHSSLHDLRLSFPDPITSSREDLVTSSYEDVSTVPDAAHSASASYVITTPQAEQETAEETLIQECPTSEFNIFLYGLSTPFKWSVVIDLLEKVARGAGVTFITPPQGSDDSVRQFVVATRPERGNLFPSTITVTDKTHQQYSPEGSTLICANKFPSLAIVYMPYCPPHFLQPTFYLPVLAPTELEGFSDSTSNLTQVAQETWDMFHIPERQVLCLTPKRTPAVVDKSTIDDLDPLSAYRAFNRMWSTKRKAMIKTSIGGVHTLTILAVLSLLLGAVIRSTFSAPGRVATVTPTVVAIPDNCSSTSLWQLLRPVIDRQRGIPPPPAAEPSSVAAPASLKEFALSIFSVESTSIALPRSQHSPNLRRMPPSTLHERLLSSKDLVLRPTLSVLVPDTQAVSVASTATQGQAPSPTSRIPSSLSAVVHASAPDFVKEYAPIISAAIANDLQIILDALDALVLAISKQVRSVVVETALLVQRSLSHLETSAEKLESIKDALYTRNARAKKRAKQLKERGARWLFEASEIVTNRAKLAKGTQHKVLEETKVFVDGMASRVQRARGNAKKVAEEIHELIQEQEKLAIRAWDIGEQQWKHWQRKHSSKACKSKRSSVGVKKGIFCGL